MTKRIKISCLGTMAFFNQIKQYNKYYHDLLVFLYYKN